MEKPTQKKPVTYYVDFENVHNEGLEGIKQLDEDSQVFVFYSKKANTIAIDQAIDVFASKADVTFVKIENGTPNALDFQLTTMLVASLSPEREYVIVSADTGYDAVLKMAKRLELPKITRRIRISGKKAAKAPSGLENSTLSVETPAPAAAPVAEPEAEPASAQESAAAPSLEPAPAAAPIDAPEHKGDIPVQETDEPADESGAPAQSATEPARETTTAQAAVSSKPAEEPEANDNAPSQQAPQKPKSTKRRDLVNQTLVDAGVTLKPQQLSSVMNALNSTSKKHDFYIQIIRSEGQQPGISLYRRVRDHYGKLSSIVRP